MSSPIPIPPEILALILDTGKVFAQSAAYDLLKKSVESAAADAKKLDAIYNEPLLTGLRIARDAAAYPVDKRVGVFHDLLQKAGDDLEKALTLFSQGKKTEMQKSRALAGLVWIYAQRPNGEIVAQARSKELQGLLLAGANALREEQDYLEKRLKRMYEFGPPQIRDDEVGKFEDFGYLPDTIESGDRLREDLRRKKQEIAAFEKRTSEYIARLLGSSLPEIQ